MSRNFAVHREGDASASPRALRGLVLALSAAALILGCTAPAPTADPETSDHPSPGSAPSTVEETPTATESSAGASPATPEESASGDASEDATAGPPTKPAEIGSSTWTAPKDPEADGPTAAPALPEVTVRSDEKAALPTEMVVRLTSITTTTLQAETPGEYTGPAVIVAVTVTNDSGSTKNVDSAVVNLAAEGGDVGVGTGAGPHDPLNGDVADGETVEGTYVFMLDPSQKRSVTVSVNYAAGQPVAVFTGKTS